ncbi:putative protein kinase RLK-Pelle-CrRLK1L-1 family [Helianthus annuus]|nr:putative protein kinase RLK-Pelle-CrRLK1L-1 family [Helianthus annuus]
MIFSAGDGKESEPSTPLPPPYSGHNHVGDIEFHEILAGTDNFDESLVIGRGGFGKVYKGCINHGENLVVSAIKRLDPESSQGASEFWSEVQMLSRLRHCNIVSLIGYCTHEQEKILVYEYMPNGTLSDHLHKQGTPLSWFRRLNICIGAGLGLRYLHNDVGIDSGVIHRDFKSSNILLNESWESKISDFGLSKTCPTNQLSTHVNTLVKGTFGYLDPNYFRTGKLTRKSDVYAFGVVLLEVLCGKPALEELVDGEWRNLATWAQDSIKEGNLKNIIDSDIMGEISPKCLRKFVKMTERCLHDNTEQRPTMDAVVVTLKSVLALQEKLSMQAAGSRTIFGRMVDLLPFPTNGENSGRVEHNTLAPSKHGDGIVVAVKMLTSKTRQAYDKRQTKHIAELAHPNINIGGIFECRDSKHKYFNQLLFPNGGNFVERLSWGTRLMIMIGVARGLTYLHLNKVHCDIRPSNILLDEEFNAKLEGITKTVTKETHISTWVRETMYYMAPEYFWNGDLSMKSDIYSFGVVLLESMTGRKAWVYGHIEKASLVDWASTVKSRIIYLKEIMDPRLNHNYPLQGAFECFDLVLRCIANESKDRPSSKEVLQTLERIYALNK